MCVATDPNDPSPPSNPRAMDSSQQALLLLLEHAASDDLLSFTHAAAESGLPLDGTSRWYARWWPTHDSHRRTHYETRSPLMVAALHGSAHVVEHLLSADPTSANRHCGSDSATPLHCAAAGGSPSSPQVIRLLLSAGADPSLPDASGRIPADVIPRHSRSGPAVEALLRGGSFAPEETKRVAVEKKKEYPVDATLPDIKSGVYGTDEFRMYSFKVKPCSRAYSHDWTECPFVHPGENARRRDPRKYHYSCVPCPDFRKGSCRSGDACEYAHGVFESWLHPAQYRTRLCKDEAGCTRRVCFFAHKSEELRPLYPSSPSSASLVSSPRASNLPPLDLGAAAMLLQQPLSPSASTAALAAWLNAAATTPTSPLPSSRLKAGIAARDIELDLELMAFDGYKQQQQNLMDEIGGVPISPTPSWSNPLQLSRGAEEMFGSLDSSSSLHSPMNTTGSAFHQHQHQQLYAGGNLPPSPSARASSPSPSLATTLMSARASAFAKQRSRSFVDRGSIRLPSLHVPSTPAVAAFSDWGSPDGKLDWAIRGEELSKLRKSASFAFRGGDFANSHTPAAEEPDVSWVQSLVKDGPPTTAEDVASRRPQCPRIEEGGGGGEDEKFSSGWAEQLYLEKEQMVA